MVKKKQSYESPDIKVTHVELESSICAGSVDFKQDEEGATIQAQQINTNLTGGDTFITKDSDGNTTGEYSGYFNTNWNPGSGPN